MFLLHGIEQFVASTAVVKLFRTSLYFHDRSRSINYNVII